MTSPHSVGHGQADPGVSSDQAEAGYVGQAPEQRLIRDAAAAAWPALMAGGLGCLAVGILLLAWPTATLAIVAVLIGIALVVAGLQRLIHGFSDQDVSGGRRAASVVVGLLAILVGLYAIRHYNVTIAALAIAVGLFWVINGIADISVGLIGEPRSGRFLTVLAGVLSLAAGLIVLFWPAISLTVLVVVIGIWLIVYGLILTVMAFTLRRAGSAAPGPERLASG